MEATELETEIEYKIIKGIELKVSEGYTVTKFTIEEKDEN